MTLDSSIALLCGLPGSGKSTQVKSIVQHYTNWSNTNSDTKKRNIGTSSSSISNSNSSSSSSSKDIEEQYEKWIAFDDIITIDSPYHHDTQDNIESLNVEKVRRTNLVIQSRSQHYSLSMLFLLYMAIYHKQPS